MTAAAMGDPAAKRKVTVARLTTTKRNVSPASSRPSSRNSASRPASPTKPFISSNSPLIRPKAKVNSSALRRTSSSHTPQSDSPVNPARPPSPTKSVASPITRVRSPPASTIGIGSTRKSTTARVKASVSVTSDASFKAKSPSPELRNRPSTASSDIAKPPPNSRERQESPATTVLHHASSFSALQPRSPSPSTPNYASMRIQGSRLAQSELGISLSSSETHVDNERPVLPPIKIRSKVSAMAKNVSEPPEISPSISSKRSVPPRVRVPSVSSIASFVSTPSSKTASPSSSASATSTAYPITTASPAANPHRYPSSKPSPATSGLRSSFSSSSCSASPRYTSAPPESRPQFDDFRPYAKTTTSSVFPPSPNSNGYSRRPSVGGSVARIIDDPANVPLPPQSPPTSSLSVSSRSSTSYVGTSPDSPVSFSFNLASPKTQSLKETLDTLNAYVSTRDDGGKVQEEEEDDDDDDDTSSLSGLTVEEDDERKVRAQAKSNRKIADLEITNRSLLAINASLEKTKDRQAKEIRELKRKLRESRLILPPRAFRAVKSSLDPEEIGDDEEDIESSDDDNDDNAADDDDNDDDDNESMTGNETAPKGSSDETYGRIKLLINNLLKIGRQALEDTKENHMETKSGTKVLTAEEVESWRDSAGAGLGAENLSDQGSHSDVVDHSMDDFDEDDYAAGLPRGHSLTPQPVTFNGNTGAHNGCTDSIIIPSSSPQLPPILITEPS